MSYRLTATVYARPIRLEKQAESLSISSSKISHSFVMEEMSNVDVDVIQEDINRV